MAITLDGSDNKIAIGANATGPSYLRLYEDTDNGTHYLDIIAPASLTSNRTLTLPDSTGTLINTAPGTNGNVLTSNGTDWVSQAPAAGGGATGIGATVFTSSGTFTIPSGVTAVKATIVGGGGGGGRGNGQSAGGGGGGGAAIKYLTSLTAGNTISVTVGGAGTGRTGSAGTGTTGGTSSIASGTQSITTVSATGGSGGSGSNLASGATPGNGGVGSSGDANINGCGGVYGFSNSTDNAYFGGIGGNSILGGGAVTTGTNYGGGGGGGASGNDGYNGGGGIVIFEY